MSLMTDLSPSRPPKRYSPKQFTAWRERWTGIEPDEALRTQPFGKTEDGLFDLRGLTICPPQPGEKCDWTMPCSGHAISPPLRSPRRTPNIPFFRIASSTMST
ncbi:hypothetical protein [Acidiphilium iwatense]|uniref:hypothetical protein n=1 Tax=Acidiphilium iwatense TaxID=768198 RepID=UPI001F4553C4|nr:hypothetical protein [Acidiphilium iwatense]